MVRTHRSSLRYAVTVLVAFALDTYRVIYNVRERACERPYTGDALASAATSCSGAEKNGE